MKILWLASEAPVAPLTGGRERTRKMLEYVAARHDVFLVCRAAGNEQPALRKLGAGLAGIMTLPYAAGGERWKQLFNRMRVRMLRSRFRPDAVHAQAPDMWHMLPPDLHCRVIADFHDVPGLDLADREVEAAIAVSAADKASLESMISARTIYTLPNGVDLAYWGVALAQPEPHTILFPAAFNWPPNHQAAVGLTDTILPLIKAHIPDIRLILAGRMPPEDLARRASGHPGVTLVRDPFEMRELFARASAIVVPVTGVSGARLKILQALAAGRPVVSTPEGAAGLGLKDGEHLLIAQMGQPFADAICRLLNDPVLRQSVVDNGQRIIERYDWANFLPVLDEIYAA